MPDDLSRVTTTTLQKQTTFLCTSISFSAVSNCTPRVHQIECASKYWQTVHAIFRGPFNFEYLFLCFFLILSNRVFTNCTQVVIENYVLVQFYNCTSRIKGANKNFPFALNHFYSYFGTPYCISQNFTF